MSGARGRAYWQKPAEWWLLIVGVVAIVGALYLIWYGVDRLHGYRGWVMAYGGVMLGIAGGLSAVRRRADLVIAILTALTAASFGIGLTVLSWGQTQDHHYVMLTPPMAFGAILFGVLVARGAFDR